MKRKIALIIACSMVLSLAGCASESGAGADSGLQVESVPAAETTEATQTTETTEAKEPTEESQEPSQAESTESADTTARSESSDLITEDQAREAVKKYCIEDFPDLADKVDSDDYTIYWEAATIETGEICVLYRAYTGALIRYYVDPKTGETHVTEQVPGIIDEEQETGETLNIRDYIE